MPAPKDIFAALQGKGKITKVCATNSNSKRTAEQILSKMKISHSKRVGGDSIPDTQEIPTGSLFGNLKRTHKVTVFPNLVKITPIKPTYHETEDVVHQPMFFDLDDTIITRKSGRKFGYAPHDWKWLHEEVPVKLQSLHSSQPIIIISNQATTSALSAESKSLSNIITKIEYIFKDMTEKKLNVERISFYCSTNRKGIMRKPEIGIFTEFKKDYGVEFDIELSCFIGDAAGRATDFSDSDKKFAEGCGLKFLTPEEYYGI
ncbi:hypothetical protein WICPIJ_005969 [Wickerhamomyces pijperi]|uniref:DNA 3'-phosphatase n=1 Tax=Wickerhamomyces pijperi TaxID=599730 RepID=A0A9P8TLG4_WICPI|nr:hypothetical protein WICPIJ_005969 [Wickerhamomyces pijperi]